MSTIFIQIASYKDPQLIPTLDDCIKNAKHPENLRFGIAWQHAPEENINKYKDDPRFRIIDIPYQESKGACWARNKIQQVYNGEKYTLQLDSHHRFIQNWDEE
jgi:glycosyltransferase involved in cell wall biosynthesis